MKIVDYFKGRRIRLRSNLPVDVVMQGINANARSSFRPFGKGVAGWARFGWIRLRYKDGYFEYPAMPVLAGSISDHLGGSLLDLRYRAPLKVYPFLFLWYAMLIWFTNIMISGLDEARDPQMSHIILALCLGAVFLPPVVHWIGTLDAESELDRLLQFLDEKAQATPWRD